MKLELPNNSNEIGKYTEKIACDYLIAQGLLLLDKNYHCRRGEIDLVMKDNETIIFVEVRFRKNNYFGDAKESITPLKQKKLHVTALHYMQKKQLDNQARFDVIAITGTGRSQNFEWLKNAF